VQAAENAMGGRPFEGHYLDTEERYNSYPAYYNEHHKLYLWFSGASGIIANLPVGYVIDETSCRTKLRIVR